MLIKIAGLAGLVDRFLCLTFRLKSSVLLHLDKVNISFNKTIGVVKIVINLQNHYLKSNKNTFNLVANVHKTGSVQSTKIIAHIIKEPT